MPLTAAIIIPTRKRAGYLDRALATICPQASQAGAEVLVVDDGPDEETREIAQRHGARYAQRAGTPGLNAARNTAIAHTGADLLCFVDDDAEVAPGWLGALLHAAAELPDAVGVLTGPIRPRFEDHRLRLCGREGPPITFLDLGPRDQDCHRAWGANMAIRRSALERVGRFDESIQPGDEEDWQQRWIDTGGRIRYIAGAGLDHVRRDGDSTMRSLCRAAYHRGRGARRFDAIRGQTPALASELRVLAGCLLHGPRHLCMNGPIMSAHSLGRIAEACRPTPRPARAGIDDFLSGASGSVGGRRAIARRVADLAMDIRTALRRRRLRHSAAKRQPRRRILVAGIRRDDVPSLMEREITELADTRHDVTFDIRPLESGGKFENLNAILADHEIDSFDHLLVIDDDIELPRGFLDILVHCAERGDLVLAQPAHRLLSHAAWPVTRRTSASWRETTFVEIGPATLFSRAAFDALLPFPEGLRMGWGLDAHWSAVARDHGWRIGVVDAVPIAHVLRPIAGDYPHDQAIAEARSFLAGRSYIRRDEVRTLAAHR